MAKQHKILTRTGLVNLLAPFKRLIDDIKTSVGEANNLISQKASTITLGANSYGILPDVTVSLLCATDANNMDRRPTDCLQLHGGGSGSANYQLTVPSGYTIVTVNFDYRLHGSATATITVGGNSYSAAATDQHATATINAASATFAIADGNRGVELRNFVALVKRTADGVCSAIMLSPSNGELVSATASSANFCRGIRSRTSQTSTIFLPAYPTSLPASDVHDWAKAENKPTYTAAEVGAATVSHTHSGTYAAATHYHSATYINSGTLAIARIPSLSATKITSDQFAIARIPTGTTEDTVALGNHTHSEYQPLKFLNATTLDSLPIENNFIVATLSANASFSLESVPPAGREIHVVVCNTASAAITIAIPNTGSYKASEDTLSVDAGGRGEINAISDGTNIYVRSV